MNTMTTDEITKWTKQIVQEQLNPESIDLSKTFADHGADSLDEVEIIMDFEETFDLDIDDEDAERLAKLPIKETIAWLENKLAPAST